MVSPAASGCARRWVSASPETTTPIVVAVSEPSPWRDEKGTQASATPAATSATARPMSNNLVSGAGTRSA